MQNRLWIATMVLGSLVLAARQGAAQRPYLWWASRIVNASGVNDCLMMAEVAMNEQGLSGVTRDRGGVAGVTEKSYAIITCVEGSDQRMTAVIMVASNDRDESEQLRNKLADGIRPSPITVSISPTSVNIVTPNKIQFSATVSGTSNQAVQWDTNCPSANISPDGSFTAYEVPGPPGVYATCNVTATSVARPSVFGKATVRLSRH